MLPEAGVEGAGFDGRAFSQKSDGTFPTIDLATESGAMASYCIPHACPPDMRPLPTPTPFPPIPR